MLGRWWKDSNGGKTGQRWDSCWRNRSKIETDMKRWKRQRWDTSEPEMIDGTEVRGWWGTKIRK